MANTLRVSIQPNNGATRVIRIAQPSLRVTISKGGGAVLPTEKTFGAAKVYGILVKGYAANGLPNADTQAAIDYALAQGYPAWSIIWMYQGEAVAGSVSSTASVPAFGAWATFTPPSVAATAVGEAVSASATIPALMALASFTAPTVTSGFGTDATVSAPQFSAVASFIAPTVTGHAGVTATATVPQFSAISTFAAPTVYATRNATATVPQLSASATFAAPSVTVTPAGATAATVTFPSFGAVATFAAPSVTAQGAATASVPSFSAMASLSAPSVTGVVQTLATVTVPQFAATSTFTAPAVTAQRAATAAVPSLSATSTLTAPNVAATRVATASVPSFGATAALTAPTVTGVQQAAAVSATATVPSFTATATFSTPSATGVQMSAAPTQPVISATGGDTTVTIALTSGGVGATSYDLKWGTSAGSRPNTISGVTLPYTHTGRTNGTTYYYSLVATNAQGTTESAEVSAAVVAASASYSDNFNRADGGLGSNWTTVTGKEAPVISSQKAGKSGLSLTHAAYWSANTFANDQWAIARVYPETYYGTAAAAANSLAAGPAVRCSSGSMGYHASALNYYDSDMAENGFVVSLWRNGTFMQYYYNANAPTPNEYSHIKISAVGTTVTVYGGQTVNGPWETLIELSSSNISSGSIGTVIGGFTYSYVDDWSGGDV